MNIETHNELPDRVDPAPLERAVRAVVSDAGYLAGSVSLAVVDDPTIHRLNRQFLEHDYETDVLSFVLERRPGFLEGEVVLSADTAQREAPGYGWSAAEELLLYAIHGALHLVGYDDATEDDNARMRSAEARYLRQMGVEPPQPDSPPGE